MTTWPASRVEGSKLTGKMFDLPEGADLSSS
jgi:hypothetical protein